MLDVLRPNIYAVPEDLPTDLFLRVAANNVATFTIAVILIVYLLSGRWHTWADRLYGNESCDSVLCKIVKYVGKAVLRLAMMGLSFTTFLTAVLPTQAQGVPPLLETFTNIFLVAIMVPLLLSDPVGIFDDARKRVRNFIDKFKRK